MGRTELIRGMLNKTASTNTKMQIWKCKLWGLLWGLLGEDVRDVCCYLTRNELAKLKQKLQPQDRREAEIMRWGLPFAF